jgi:hypothetical protein
MRRPGAVRSIVGTRTTLPRKIAAIQLTNESGLGLFTELPEGALIEICSSGFDDKTVKVRCRDEFYFVFQQDTGLQF